MLVTWNVTKINAWTKCNWKSISIRNIFSHLVFWRLDTIILMLLCRELSFNRKWNRAQKCTNRMQIISLRAFTSINFTRFHRVVCASIHSKSFFTCCVSARSSHSLHIFRWRLFIYIYINWSDALWNCFVNYVGWTQRQWQRQWQCE